MNPRVVLLPLAVLLVGGGIALATRSKGPAKPTDDGKVPGVPVPAATDDVPKGHWRPQPVHTHTAPTTETIPCKVVAPEPVKVFPTVASTPVEKVLALEGQSVKKGDLLVTFAPAQWERALAAAEKSGDARGIEEAKRALAALELRAPEDGIIYSMAARRGERPLEMKGTPLPLVVLFDWRRLSYEATAPASLAPILATTPRVFVRMARDALIEAEFVVNGPAAADGTVPVVLRPKDAPTAVPEPGGAGEIAVTVGTRQAPIVPTTAIRASGGRNVVYVVTITGGLVARPVILGILAPNGFIEASGVSVGESVAVWD